MRVVLDTNLLISALMSQSSPPAQLVDAWLAGRFTLVSSREQLAEFRRASRYPHVAPYIAAPEAGTLVNAIRALAVLPERLPVVNVAADPEDDYVLAMAKAGRADYLATGDRRSGLLSLGQSGRTRIVTAAQLLAVLNRR
jgi:uncharacterized protein